MVWYNADVYMAGELIYHLPSRPRFENTVLINTLFTYERVNSMVWFWPVLENKSESFSHIEM